MPPRTHIAPPGTALLLAAAALTHVAAAQEVVRATATAVDSLGLLSVTVDATPDRYYVLEALNPGAAEHHAVALAEGRAGALTLADPLPGFAPERYRVRAWPVDAPGDRDGDGRDDLAEFADAGRLGPLNPAPPVAPASGAVYAATRADLEALAVAGDPDDPVLAGRTFAKFYVLDNEADATLAVYLMNTRTHPSHADFARAEGLPIDERGVSRLQDMRGTIVYHPDVTAANGARGLYTYHFGLFNEYEFAVVQRTHDRLAAAMPFLRGNLAFRPLYERSWAAVERERPAYEASRIPLVTEEALFAGVDFIGLNPAVGFGRLRELGPGQTPSPFDVVVSETLPNELPRVGGIVTSVVQTPLSHVNLRALQDGTPNAYLRDATADARVRALLGEYVRLEVTADTLDLRRATRAEVDAHFADLRPPGPQVLAADLTARRIRPLDSLGFADAASVGAKAANVAELRTLGFPARGTPDGYAVPFAFYAEFMAATGLDAAARDLIADEGLRQNPASMQEALATLRARIEAAPMPADLRAALGRVQEAFPPDERIRCRSSTNNEDLPGFSGAGLYDSKTHRPDEGHLAHTAQQVFAGLWNYRAFVERDFYRVDHHSARMGVLVHASYRDERVNGVAVSTDPLYATPGTYYVNAQVGEDLVTNPEARSTPEELLVPRDPDALDATRLLRPSNRARAGERVLRRDDLAELRDRLTAIHEHFAPLYGAVGDPDFAMEVEFKVDADGELVVKQARPWVGFERASAATPPTDDAPAARMYPNPAGATLYVEVATDAPAAATLVLADALGREVARAELPALTPGRARYDVSEALTDLASGLYAWRLGGAEGPQASGTLLLGR